MSTKNITYPIKIVIKSIIEQVFERVYNQLPLQDIDYPFAVYNLFLVDNCPGIKCLLTIDLWSNNSNQIEFQNQIDRLVSKLDYINYSDKSLHFSAEVDTIQDITTQEEDLIRSEIKVNLDIYKVV